MEGSRSEIIGRDEELVTVRALVAGLDDGAAALVLEGPAGVGKTTLWAAGVEAADAGALVLTAHPGESETALSYAGLGDLIDAVVDEIASELSPPQWHALEVALLRKERRGRPPDRRAVSLGALSALRALSQIRPVVVAVDDVQWLDAPSAAVLEFVARRVRKEPIGFLFARRAERSHGSELGRGLPEERVQRIEVGPLDVDAVYRLLHRRLGVVFPRPLVRRVHELAEGNPFFALELGRALASTAMRLDPQGRLPVSLERLVEERLAALPVSSRHALAVAAAASQPTLTLVERVIGASASRRLLPAVRAEVIELGGDVIRFAHPLLASAAYRALVPRQRRTLHRRLAELTDAREERGRHLALAATRANEEIAAALDAAAHEAIGRGAPAAAAELSERAAALTPVRQQREVRRRQVDAAVFHFESGDSRRARAMLERLADAVPAGPEHALILTKLARVRSYDDDLRVAADLFLQAVAESGDDEAVLAAAHEGAAATLFRLRERLAEAVEHSTAAVRLAKRVGNPALMAEALGTQLLAEAALGRPEAPDTLARSFEVAAATREERILARPEFPAGVVWMWWDELDRARATFEELIRRAQEFGDESSLPYVLVLLAQAEFLAGEFGVARSHAEEGYDLAEQAGQAWVQAYLLALRALALAVAGDVEGARAAGLRALGLAAQTSGRPAEHFAIAALGLLELSLGQGDAAVERFLPFVRFVRDQEISEPGVTRPVEDAVEALVETGRLDEAEELLGWYERNAERVKRASALAAAGRCRGLLLAARGELDAAEAILVKAVEHHRHPLPFARARTLLVLGAVRRRAKQKRAAREALETALAEFERLGARLWADRARSELARVGGRVPSAGTLTPTEQKIAELVGQGRSNKEVAAALFVTVKTVEAHLSRIYAKLGVRSRAELAHRLSQDLVRSR